MVSTKKEVKNYRFYPPPFYLYTSDNQILSNQTILSSNQNNLAAYSTRKHFLSNYILKNHQTPDQTNLLSIVSTYFHFFQYARKTIGRQ